MEEKQKTKSALLEVAEQLSAERLSEVLDFALFVRARQQAYTITDVSASNDTPYPLKDSVIRYEAPFDPVASEDWESQNDSP